MKKIRGIWLPDDDDHFQGHLEAGPEYAGAGTYQWKKTYAALRLVPDDRRRLAVDVGAHVGLWTRVLAREFARVVAFEPVPAAVECWLANMADCENAELRTQAVGCGTGDLYIERVVGNSGNCRVLKVDEARDPDTVVQATMVTLDDALRDRTEPVDFLKIDVEGWERDVVLGAKSVLAADRPIVVVEQKPGNAERYGLGRTDAVDLLKRWGASVYWEKAGDFCLGWS